MPIVAMIEETIDISQTKISWADIAKAGGISKPAIKDFRDGSELKFHTLLKIAQYLFKGSYMKHFKEWCLSLHWPKNIKHALEYLAINRQTHELEILIANIRKEHSDAKLLNWADGYEILLNYLKGEDYLDVLNQIRGFTSKATEMTVLISIVEVWCRYKLHDYLSMEALIRGLEVTIGGIQEDFIRESYLVRLKEAQSYVSLYKLDDRVSARKYAEEIISSNISPTFTAGATYLLGMSFLFDDYDACLGNIIRHRELLIEAGRNREVNIIDNCDIPFINNVWKKYSEQPKTSDISEKAHYEAVAGDKALAVELVDKAIEENGLSGFRAYYKALATNDMAMFMQSMIIFVNKKGDKFYANLPYQHLKNDPVYKPMADLLLAD